VLFNFKEYLTEKKVNEFYNDELNPKFWTKKIKKDGSIEWELDRSVRRKLLKIADDFYSKFEDTIGKPKIVDVQLTGSLANYNYTKYSDLDVHVLIDFDKIDAPKKVLNTAIHGIKFIWNLRHDIKIRGHEVEAYMEDLNSDEPLVSSGLYSLKDGEWITKPVFDPPIVNPVDVQNKFESIASDIDKLEQKLIKNTKLDKDAKLLFERAGKLKNKIMKMRKEGLSKEGEFSVGNLAFKKLRNKGYIEKLIDTISLAYDKIYSE
jgi:predicted nucleotidyltransferase